MRASATFCSRGAVGRVLKFFKTVQDTKAPKDQGCTIINHAATTTAHLGKRKHTITGPASTLGKTPQGGHCQTAECAPDTLDEPEEDREGGTVTAIYHRHVFT